MSDPLELSEDEVENATMDYGRFLDLVNRLSAEAATAEMRNFVAELLLGADEKVKG